MVHVVLLINSCESDVSNNTYHLNTNAIAELLIVLLKKNNKLACRELRVYLVGGEIGRIKKNERK